MLGFQKNRMAPLMIMEYMDGGNLSTLLKDEYLYGLPFSMLHRIATDVALGLQYIHRQGFTHRDIKPSNILLSKCYQVAKIAGMYTDIHLDVVSL